MPASWPPPPDWLSLAVAPRRLARGDGLAVVARAPAARLAERPFEIGIGCLAHYAAVAKTGEAPDVGGRFKTYRQTFIHEEWRPLVPGEPATLTVPADAPYTYEGDVISFYWGRTGAIVVSSPGRASPRVSSSSSTHDRS